MFSVIEMVSNYRHFNKNCVDTMYKQVNITWDIKTAKPILHCIKTKKKLVLFSAFDNISITILLGLS